MRRVRKKNILNRIDDSINDKIDELKEKKKEKKKEKNISEKKKNNSYKKEDNKIVKSKNKIEANKHKDKNKKNKEKKHRRPFWKKLLTFILIMGIIGVLAVSAFLGYIVLTAPEFNESDLKIQDQTVVYDINGAVIAKLGSQKRESVSYDDLPQVLIDAIIATEDSRFFQHNGVDLFRFIKATIQQLLGQDEAGGASTLTMQTVKNNLTKKDSEEKSDTVKEKIKKVIRKFQDVYLSVFKVEKEYSKEEILEMYVNDNYLGGSYYGVEEASKYYFNKSVSDITLPEAAVIAGLFQLPGKNNPYNNPEGATKRRSLVLQYMVNHGYITKEEKALAEKISVESLLAGNKSEETAYQGYIDTVVAEIEEKTGDNPYKVPMKIYTTMEKSIQDGINNVLKSNDKSIWKDEKVQGGIAIVNAETGAIAAVGAGRNKTGERQFNYATQAYRQPGSTSKPIFDYGPAIEYLNYSTFTQVLDEKWSYTNGPNVNNWDGGYHGLRSIRYHLQVSRNVPALKTFQAVGPKNSQKFASALGLDVALNSSSENYHVYEDGSDNAINEAYSIGGASKGFTPLDMATAYACFANGGYYIEPHTVTKIIYRDTNEEKEFKYTKERVMKDSTAYIMNNILESAVTGGFNGGANVAGSHVAAKTGTSNFPDAIMEKYRLPGGAVNDLWTVAYTSKYSIAVWYGYDNVDSKYYNDWGGYKDNLTRAVMQYIPKDTKGWSMPSSVIATTVEKETVPAALPSEYTPNDMKELGFFVRGTQPTEVSERYQRLPNVTNVKNSKMGNKVTISWDYSTPKVLTKSYLESYFNKSTFGNSKAAMVASRMKYNTNTLGDIVFGIYKKDTSGTLTLVEYVNENTYTYQGYGDTTLVIKAEHKKFKNNASTGTEIQLTLDELKIEDLTATFNGSATPRVQVRTYEETGFKNIMYGNLDVTTTATIKYQVSGDTNIYTSKQDLEKYVNTLAPGNYTITYTINYMNLKEITKTRSLTLIS